MGRLLHHTHSQPRALRHSTHYCLTPGQQTRPSSRCRPLRRCPAFTPLPSGRARRADARRGTQCQRGESARTWRRLPTRPLLQPPLRLLLGALRVLSEIPVFQGPISLAKLAKGAKTKTWNSSIINHPLRSLRARRNPYFSKPNFSRRARGARRVEPRRPRRRPRLLGPARLLVDVVLDSLERGDHRLPPPRRDQARPRRE